MATARNIGRGFGIEQLPFQLQKNYICHKDWIDRPMRAHLCADAALILITRISV
jgi:hypothetical protein